jgi:hypothetical protein
MIDSISDEYKIRTGDHIRIWSGYEKPYEWLWGRREVSGIVVRWEGLLSESRVCFVKLDDPLPRSEIELLTGSMSGLYVALKLRYVKREWTESGTVSVSVYSAIPSDVEMSEDGRDFMVESHAKYSLINVRKS